MMKKIRVFINGFGRIGRATLKILLEEKHFEVVGINDIYEYDQMRYLLEYDSVYGVYQKDIKLIDDTLYIDKNRIKLYNCASASLLNLKDVDILLECTGIFLDQASNEIFLKRGAKKVIISAPASEDIPRFIIDINHKEYQGETIISNSSCSANALVPILSIVDKNKKIVSGSFSMFHSYTAYQKLLDVKHYSKDMRRSRSATQNIEPLMSSAAKECEYFFSGLKDRLYAKSIRVPVKATTLYDLTLKLANTTTLNELNSLLREGAESFDKISIAKDNLVSSDYIKNSNAAILDLSLNQVIEGNLIKVFAWQDNEWGYAYQLVRMAKEIG